MPFGLHLGAFQDQFWGFMEENKKEILLMFAYNFGMLAFGFLGEVNIISKYISTPIGFYFFYK